MECSIELLDLASAKEPIPDWDLTKPTVDPYQAMQVHDYLQVSFFRAPAEVKTASKKTIELFQKYYPELLEKKFFVNVPVIMGWVYNAMRLLIAKETFKKLTMLSYGAELAKQMGSDSIPADYGGKGRPLKDTAISSGGSGTGGEAPKEGVSEVVSKETAETAPAPTAETTETASKEQPNVPAAQEAAGGKVKAGDGITSATVSGPIDQTVPAEFAPTETAAGAHAPESK